MNSQPRISRRRVLPASTLFLCAIWLCAGCNTSSGQNQSSQTGQKNQPSPNKESSVSTTTNNSGPPGPPGPPPANQQQDVSRYQSYLAAKGIQASELHEEERLRVGSWRFYYAGPATRREHQVGLDDAGHAITVEDKSTWNALLSTPEVDAPSAHKLIAWLMGRAGPIVPGHNLSDPAAAAKLTAPTLERAADGSVTFTGWVLYPPNMNTPYRITVKAPKSGAATVENTVWNKL
jgi:hypothetical protein